MKVLISAPYMLKDRIKVEGYLKDYPWDVHWANVEERLEENDLLKLLPDFDAIICGDDRFTENVYKTCEQLKVVVKWGTGIDSIKREIAERYGVKVFRTPGAFTVPVAETTISYILAFCRNVMVNDSILKNGGWEKPNGITLNECAVGIIGFGDIGQAVAKRLLPFGCKVYVNDIKSIDKKLAVELNVEVKDKEFIYERCDIISLHCDLNETSNHLINSKAFSSLKRQPYIINTARGPLIEENSLIDALEKNIIKGVALDVFEQEPLSPNNPLRKMNNAILAAHNSNSSAFYWNKVHLNSLKMLSEAF